MKSYVDYIMEETKKILAIDSPTGFTGSAADYVMEEYEKLGYSPVKTEASFRKFPTQVSNPGSFIIPVEIPQQNLSLVSDIKKWR